MSAIERAHELKKQHKLGPDAFRVLQAHVADPSATMFYDRMFAQHRDVRREEFGSLTRAYTELVREGVAEASGSLFAIAVTDESGGAKTEMVRTYKLTKAATDFLLQ